jgi:hypothetical protein
VCYDEDKRRKIADLVTYVEKNLDGLYGSRFLGDKVEAKTVLICSTGAMERNIDTVIGRRFKKHGVNWTAEGVNNLLKLRTLRYNKGGWNTFWSREAGCGVSPPPTN